MQRGNSKGWGASVVEEDIDLLGVDIAQRYDESGQNLSETDVKEQQTYEVGYSGSNDAVTVSDDKTPKRRVLDALTIAAGVTIGLSVHGLAKALKNSKKF